MGVINRRNAVVGWVVIAVTKSTLKRKAKEVVPTVDSETKRPNKSAIALVVATTAGLVAFVRRRGGGDGGSAGSAGDIA
jgi:hypothetical protein